jgi:hypothetical protein
MENQTWIKKLGALLLAFTFITAAGFSDAAVASAQNWQWPRFPGWPSNRDRNRDRDRQWQEERKGYYDGLDRGREDYRKNNGYDPNNSSHFRKGTPAYREGFRRGYAEGFPRGRGRYGDGRNRRNDDWDDDDYRNDRRRRW